MDFRVYIWGVSYASSRLTTVSIIRGSTKILRIAPLNSDFKRLLTSPKSDILIFHGEGAQAKNETQWRKHRNRLKKDLHLALVMNMMKCTKHELVVSADRHHLTVSFLRN